MNSKRKLLNQNKSNVAVAILAAAVASAAPSAALAGISTNTSGPVQQGTSDNSNNVANNNPAVTISFSGQTALRAFDTTPGISTLQPGQSIILHNGTNGAPITYTATNTGLTDAQLASANFTTPDTNPGTPSVPSTADVQNASAIRLEWHEQGSIDGFVDLINDQVGFSQVSQGGAGPYSSEALRGPSSSNPTWINTNKFTAAGTLNGLTLNAAAGATPVYGTLSDLYNTYDTNLYTPATGANKLGGQNRVQFSVGEYPTEGLATTTGTPSPFAAAGAAGYGQGNPSLRKASNLTGLGVGNARQALQQSTIANQSTSTIDPQTGAAYPVGPWNTAATDNITSVSIAATAVTYSANPGTGLTRINKGDAQWLQTAGQLQNGALFNVVARTVNTGQRAVFALNTGIDPSWAVGSNDNGNSTSSAAASLQHSIGSSLRFDGKTSGTEAEKTIAQSRMSVGALSVPEARAAASNAPVRALNVDFNDLADPLSGGQTDSTQFIGANFNSIISSASNRYQALLISHYNVVKAPNTNFANVSAAVWAATPAFDPSNPANSSSFAGIKGDTQGTIGNGGSQASGSGDVAAFIDNIANSIGKAATGLQPSSVNDPADSLFINGFLTPNILNWTRLTDGGPITPISLGSNALSLQSDVSTNYGPLFGTDGTAGANAQTIGASANYGAGNTSGPAINGAIPITAIDSGGNPVANGVIAPAGNYLFGNFNQNGVRDFSAVQQSVNAALSLYAVDSAASGVNNIFTGLTNGATVSSLVGTPGWITTGTNTKGDLITLGDFNGDGAFNGQDLYLLATGASLADGTNSPTLTATAATFADAVRNPNAVLRKNAALDYINNYLNLTNTYTAGGTFLRQTGRAVLSGASVPPGAHDLLTTDPITGQEQYTYDLNGNHAFDKHDVNRDGVVDFNDAVLVDQYNGQSYKNLSQQLAATQLAPVSGALSSLNLVAVEQIDGEAGIGAADVAEINAGLSGSDNANWYGFNLQKSGPGTLDWERTGGTVTIYAGASLQISAGTVKIGGTLDPFTDNNAAGPTAGNHLGVSVDHGALLKFAAGTNALNTVSSLTLDVSSGATVDLGANALTIAYAVSPDATIRGYLSNAYNVTGSPWTGAAGITSSIARLDPAHHSIAFADGADGIVTNLPPHISSAIPGGGALPNGNEVIVYANSGDANIDGKVDFADFILLSNHFGLPDTHWDHGNFNFDANIDFADFIILSNNFGAGVTGIDGITPTPAQLAQYNALAVGFGISKSQIAGWDTAISNLPEPSASALLGLSTIGLLKRKRHRN